MQIEDWVGPILVVLFIAALIAEAIVPRERQVNLRGWRLVGIAAFIVNAGLNTGVPLLLPNEWIAAHSLLPGMQLGIWKGFLVGFVAWEFVYYWIHRSEHRFTMLWQAMHQLHHSPQRMDVSGFPFTHPLEIVVLGILSVVVTIGVLGLDSQAAALVGLYTAVAAVIQHTNIRTPKWIEWFWQRPEAHARHHEYGEHAGNYADWPVMDKLFGTYRAPAQGGQLRYGFDATRAKRIGAMLTFRDVNRGGPQLTHHE
jgi:sterol desaturase/sphingolipid hydroxylase (fatty acid hydroxylase superfamily)